MKLWRKSIKAQLIISFLVPFLLLSLVLFGFARYVSNYIIDEHVIPQFEERLKENGHSLAGMLDPGLIQNTMNDPAAYGNELKEILDSFMETKTG